MTNKEKKDWLSVQYPLTVICDRYDGTYSGAKWLAFPLDYDKIPGDVDASDPECAQFWEDYKEPVGKGAYASDAVADLIQQMRVSEPEESEDERVRKIISDSVFYQYGAGAEYKDVLDYLDKLEQQEKKEVKFVFPKFLYARTTNNKTIDMSYAPQSLDAVEYIRSDSLQQEQSCDTCTNDKGCVTCKDGGLWEGKEQPSGELEAEIGKVFFSRKFEDEHGRFSIQLSLEEFSDIAKHFAEWQKSQMPMPEDTVIFQKGIAEGKRLMMEDAVEAKGVICKLSDRVWISPVDEEKFHQEVYDRFVIGQTVKIVIIPDKED